MKAMINAITPYRAPNVPIRDKVMPMSGVARVEMNPHQSKTEYEKTGQSKYNNSSRPKLNTQSFNPFFAIHILMEAGEIEFDRQEDGIKAYNRRREIPKTTLIIA